MRGKEREGAWRSWLYFALSFDFTSCSYIMMRKKAGAKN